MDKKKSTEAPDENEKRLSFSKREKKKKPGVPSKNRNAKDLFITCAGVTTSTEDAYLRSYKN